MFGLPLEGTTLTPVAVLKAVFKVLSNYFQADGDFCSAISSPLGFTAVTDARLMYVAFDACSSGIESTRETKYYD
jgi:hypothetical protein